MKRWIHASKSTRWISQDVIPLGQLSRPTKSISTIDVNQLSEDDIGTTVYVLENDRTNTDSRRLQRGVISDVRIDDKIDRYHTHKTAYAVVELADGSRRFYDTNRWPFATMPLYDESNAQKLIDLSNKQKGIDHAAESMSRDDLHALAKSSGLENVHKKFDSEEYGPDAEISVGYYLADTELILFCYISPAGGGHVNHGSTIEVGYAYVNGRLKRHKGAFDMPAGRGWIDNKKVQPSNIDQFNHDVEVLEEVFADPEQYTSPDIMKML